MADSIRGGLAQPVMFAGALAHHSASFGLRHDDGTALLAWLLELTGKSDWAM
ncbi:MAG TPA: hypothetical protein VG015_05610 [Candidatus Dormibacteraeota bacterium]|nr:hypothetical protein [Candidatus Dormibacteraeota bacterium]